MTTILIPLCDDVTHLDFTGPHQFLSRVPGANVIAASLDSTPISSDGLTFANLADLAKVERCDVLCIPGGVGCISAIENKRFMEAIRRLASTAHYLTSVCTGSLILGAAGLLNGRRAACHWAWRDMLTAFGASPEDGRVVRDGNIVTGGGVTAGVDFALILIAELWGADAAQFVQLWLEYAPAPPFDAGRPESAPTHIRNGFLGQMGDVLDDARRRVASFARQQPTHSTASSAPSR
jgi:transcriptional regulator GlxA family with amidase domain